MTRECRPARPDALASIVQPNKCIDIVENRVFLGVSFNSAISADPRISWPAPCIQLLPGSRCELQRRLKATAHLKNALQRRVKSRCACLQGVARLFKTPRAGFECVLQPLQASFSSLEAVS